METRCPVVIAKYSIHLSRIALARSIRSLLGFVPCSTIVTIPVLNFLCE
jgi:hypothetical protein